ncbi:MAG: 50S ribosomal protein L29 [Candidatus Orphnella occulta]|nr:50S ribosomal protein L29 [Candidatus Orphnella occulta]MDP8296875.1 50S ribosomal protein L29 [Candidatus Orphnella occulta]
MKPQDLRNMTKDELNHKVLSLKQELSKFLFQAKTGTIENSANISRIKKDVARIKTILKEESYAK